MPQTSRPLALVTGASSGIGLSFSRHLAKAGYDLVVTARRGSVLNELRDELRQVSGVEILEADLETPQGLQAVVDRIQDGTPISMLVNNAGFAARGQVGEFDPTDFDRMIRLNVTAPAHLASAAMKRMRTAGTGTIINVSSGTMFMQLPGNSAYGASKNFVSGFTRTLQVEAEGSGVRVQLLVPGVIATDFHRVAGNDLANFPPERVMQADDLVVASLRALELGEAVCMPYVPDVSLWDRYVEAEAALGAVVSRDKPAERYHVG